MSCNQFANLSVAECENEVYRDLAAMRKALTIVAQRIKFDYTRDVLLGYGEASMHDHEQEFLKTCKMIQRLDRQLQKMFYQISMTRDHDEVTVAKIDL